MNKFLLTIAASAAVLAAMPAAAQSYGGGYPQRPTPAPNYDRGNDNRGDDRGDYRGERGDRGGWGQGQAINARQAQIQRQIDMGVRRGSLNRMEVRDLRFRLNEVSNLERQYRFRGGSLSRQEAAVLSRKLDFVEQLLRRDLRDGDRRGGPRRGY
ncbi:hypothetical protein QO010_000131 [Caulobacter ginsengisoli]|uniref:Periplasmic heavy metal sensor n=1 Tax=Caulobacter ginsengisoli TaxID=400775 RepID=A0ABU0IK46_9CAUL|nr:hypothetical protein [Caulobacter ginsengisoli]MDQ0462383.1 hypothetical protein [Caulobacter ginsengisoli]